jgi:Tfp pilus assembly protein PilP
MMRRRFPKFRLCSIFTLLAAGVVIAAGTWAAEVKTVSPAPSPAPVANIGVSSVKAAPPVVPAEPPAYLYRSAGKPDPFLSFVETDLAQKKKQEENLRKESVLKKRPISPLQQGDISQFRLVGIAGNEKRRTAVVEDGIAKKMYTLSVGSYIGPNEGRVVEILRDRVIVEEPTNEGTKKGQKGQVRRTPMMLYKEELEGKP